MFNRIIILGNLTREPELKYMAAGTAICTIGMATNRKFKKTDGSQGEEVCFVDVVLFGRSAEIANQYLKRGSKVLIEGRLKYDTWSDANGNKRSKHSITAESLQLIDKKDVEPKNNNEPTPDYVTGSGVPVTMYPPEENVPSTDININDDEIPF